MIWFDPAATAFVDDALPGAVKPEGAVAITPERHAELLAGVYAGRRVLVGDDGLPQLSRVVTTLAATRDGLVAAIRREARRRIERVASATTQRNDNALLALAALSANAGTSAPVGWEAALARREAIDAIRAASNTAQDAVAAMTLAQLGAVDPLSLPAWPQD